MRTIAALCTVFSLAASFSAAAITGTVTDPSGKPVPDAIVQLEKAALRTTSDASGQYCIAASGNIDDVMTVKKADLLDYRQPTKSSSAKLPVKLIVCADIRAAFGATEGVGHGWRGSPMHQR